MAAFQTHRQGHELVGRRIVKEKRPSVAIRVGSIEIEHDVIVAVHRCRGLQAVQCDAVQV